MFPAQSTHLGGGSEAELHRPPSRAIRCWTLLALTFLLTCSGFAQVKREGEKAEPKWEMLQGCRLVTNSVVDGDSFHVMHQGREYIFRLYFVDSPESDPAIMERIKDQAAYFGISAKDIPRAGKAAAEFTRGKLSRGDITIVTRWQNALGRSSLVRFYGVVLVNGSNLAEELVANGWARIYGLKANWPDGPRSATFINKLKNLELSAREKRRGVWAQENFPLETGEAISQAAATNVAPKIEPGAAAAVDINTASIEELRKLPGIGPKLAERIIAHRPYNSVAELDKVPGIGPATLKRLEPMIRVGAP